MEIMFPSLYPVSLGSQSSVNVAGSGSRVKGSYVLRFSETVSRLRFELHSVAFL